jgi:hypothetical protein
MIGRLQPYDHTRNIVALDRMGRPLRFDWRQDKGKGKQSDRDKDDANKHEEADNSETSLRPSIREIFKSAGLREETPLMPEQ